MPNPKPSSMNSRLPSLRELFSKAGVRQLDHGSGKATKITFDKDFYDMSYEDMERLQKLIKFFGREYMNRHVP